MNENQKNNTTDLYIIHVFFTYQNVYFLLLLCLQDVLLVYILFKISSLIYVKLCPSYSPESSSRMTTCLKNDGMLSSASRTHSIFFCDVLDLRTKKVCKVTKVSKNAVKVCCKCLFSNQMVVRTCCSPRGARAAGYVELSPS